ncbi:hypothetical protein [Spirillospora albida]|uniref:hypothetical protein n=1 Tax=Spirillospora albida TaxID=58123 RepID=UPI0004BF3795|nr:hypothetical protein [Spirillospora albida]
MYAGGAYALTGLGTTAAAITLPDALDASAGDAARVLLMTTGAGFALFLLAVCALLGYGFVMRGVDRLSGGHGRHGTVSRS